LNISRLRENPNECSNFSVKKDLNKFLIYYNRYDFLRKDIRIPFNVVQSWFQTKPKIFSILPDIAFEMVQCSET
jgi:hypothetical protein